MHKAYVRELKPYSLDELSKRLEILPSETKSLVEKLMMRGVVRYRAVPEGNTLGMTKRLRLTSSISSVSLVSS